MEKFESHSAVTGLGMSEIGRRLMRDPLALTIDACLDAIDDAGLTREDIDGVCTYPGMVAGAPGISGAGAFDVMDALRLEVNWFNSGLEQPGQLGSVVAAMMAVATGMCRHVLCFRTVWEATYTQLQRTGKVRYSGGGGRLSGGMEWRIPYGAASAANWIALYCSNYMHRYGLTREQLGQIPINNRKNAALTPYAVYKDPLTLEDYLNARIVTTPFGLYDCDVPCDASVAFIISHVDTVRDSRRGTGIAFEAVGTEVNPAMANIVSPSEAVIVSSFHIELDGGGGDMHVTMPYSMIEPIRETLDAGLQTDVDDVDERWVNSLREDIMTASVDLECTIAEKEVTLRDIIDLEEGDVIPVDMPETLKLFANGVPVFNAKLGKSKSNLALQIVSRTER